MARDRKAWFWRRGTRTGRQGQHRTHGPLLSWNECFLCRIGEARGYMLWFRPKLCFGGVVIPAEYLAWRRLRRGERVVTSVAEPDWNCLLRHAEVAARHQRARRIVLALSIPVCSLAWFAGPVLWICCVGAFLGAQAFLSRAARREWARARCAGSEVMFGRQAQRWTEQLFDVAWRVYLGRVMRLAPGPPSSERSYPLAAFLTSDRTASRTEVLAAVARHRKLFRKIMRAALGESKSVVQNR